MAQQQSKHDQQKAAALSSRSLAIFCEQTAMLLRSGMLLSDSMRLLAEDAPEGSLREALAAACGELDDSRSFSDALKKAGVFPAHLIHMAEIGSESGSLDSVMASMADYYRKLDSMQEALKSAVLYPAVLIAMMAAVLILISAKVLPVFQTVLQSLGAELSPAALVIMRFGSLFTRFSWLAVGLMALILCAVVFFRSTQKGRSVFAGRMADTRMADSMSLASLASSMAALLASGADTERALELSIPLIRSRRVEQKARECRRLLTEEHLSFADALERSELFSRMLTGILTTGVRAGTPDQAMRYAADLCTDRFERDAAARLALIEPISVAVLSVLIGIILVSVMLPLLGVMSAIGA
ncbi:type II secretion system F family protein [Bacilliculturomica massiliensis]|uniref:type II secretion system F family protein n=1 Tax=Bacilliculturomica massiliensis TaxID=1917867 RepID=UPI001031213C|nr:type II secretion system F family protein [Bacilliculturomica massiliensis]